MCPSNVLSTITDLTQAIWEDILTVVRMVASCFGNHGAPARTFTDLPLQCSHLLCSLGIGGCICKFVSTLEPVWRRVSTSPIVRCETGDPFQLIVAQLNTMVLDWAQWAVNQLIDGVNGVFQSLPWPLDFIGRNPDDPSGPKTGPFERVCFDDPGRPRKCEGGGITVAQQARLDECEDEKLKGGLDMTCYFNRVRTRFPLTIPSPPLTQCALPPQVHSICSADEMISDYDKMFENGFEDLDQLQSEFESAFGDSYAMMDPTLVDLVQAAHTSTLSGPDLTNRRDICSGESFSSAMRLDQIVSTHPLNNHFATTADHTLLSLARRSPPVSSRWCKRGKSSKPWNPTFPLHSIPPL